MRNLQAEGLLDLTTLTVRLHELSHVEQNYQTICRTFRGSGFQWNLMQQRLRQIKTIKRNVKTFLNDIDSSEVSFFCDCDRLLKQFAPDTKTMQGSWRPEKTGVDLLILSLLLDGCFIQGAAQFLDMQLWLILVGFYGYIWEFAVFSRIIPIIINMTHDDYVG